MAHTKLENVKYLIFCASTNKHIKRKMIYFMIYIEHMVQSKGTQICSLLCIIFSRFFTGRLLIKIFICCKYILSSIIYQLSIYIFV